MNWLSILVPRFLKTADAWLLRHQPLVWRTRIHYLLFYSAIVCNLLIFGFHQGFSITADMIGYNLVPLRVVSMVLGVFAVLLWGWEIRKFAFRGKQIRQVLMTILLYWLGCASIGVNIWTFNKSANLKVGAIVNQETLAKDQQRSRAISDDIYDFNNYTNKSKPWNKELFNINDMLVRYGIPVKIKKGDFLEPDNFTPFTFERKYGIGTLEALNLIDQKIYVFERASETKSWMTVENDFRDFYFLFFMGLLGLPLLGMLFSNTSIMTVISIAFAHFVLFIGMVMDASKSEVSFRYSVIVGIGILLMLVLQKNWKPFRLIHLFALALLPIAFLFYQVENDFLYGYPKVYLSIWSGLLQTLFITLLTGIGYWLYQNRITKPQED